MILEIMSVRQSRSINPLTPLNFTIYYTFNSLLYTLCPLSVSSVIVTLIRFVQNGVGR